MNKENTLLIRLTTSCYHTHKGVHIKKSLTFLKRRSKGYNTLYEDCGNIGADEVVNNITNLHECADGIYKVVVVVFGREWETGLIDDWGYRLVKVD